jgi:hypothetical protein
MEVESNTKLLDKSFTSLANMQKFDWSQMPEALMNKDIFWSFKNPMQQASGQILIQQFQQCLEIMALGAQAGINSSPINVKLAQHDAIAGTGSPATWRTTKEEEARQEQEALLKQTLVTAAQAIGGAGQAAEQVGRGAQAVAGGAQQLGLLPQPEQPIPLKALPAPAKAA